MAPPHSSALLCQLQHNTGKCDMVKQTKYVVKNKFLGRPRREDFEMVQTELPPIKDGEILIKAEWISVDPHMFIYNARVPVPYDQLGFQVSLVLESKDSQYPAGSRVVNFRGWSDYNVLTCNSGARGDRGYKLPDLKGLPSSLAVGAMGMPGATAYFGFLDLCKPKAGETVVVTGAAGAVGSIVGQIARIKGCKVIGFTGSNTKVKWLEEELGFDKAINYKTGDVAAALKEAAPEGVDCFFDNVGGELSSQIILQMNLRGRVTACGSISSYDYDQSELPKATVIQPSIIEKQLIVQGLFVTNYLTRWPEAFADLTEWAVSGALKTREHITEGFDNIFEAFVGLLAGENLGKAVVKV